MTSLTYSIIYAEIIHEVSECLFAIHKIFFNVILSVQEVVYAFALW